MARVAASFGIAGRVIGPGRRPFVIAEAGVNHDGDLERALRLVDVAVEAGADAVKFQTFRAERVASTVAPKAGYQLETTSRSESHVDMLRRLELSPEAHVALVRRCAEKGIVFLSTPFDDESVDLLDGLGVAAFKVASGEVTNAPLLRRVASKGKPVLLSTGMATLAEVEAAVDVLRGAGARDVALFHCVSCYPALPEETNLRAMATLEAALGVPVGLSDHTTGVAVSLAAAALGASLIEKHFTLDRTLPGPDHRASLEPGELRALVEGVAAVHRALGDGAKEPVAREKDMRTLARRSLAAERDLPAGTRLDAAALRPLRPATGISPMDLDRVVGRTLARPVARGELIRWEDLE